MSRQLIPTVVLLLSWISQAMPAQAQNGSWNDVRERNREAIVYLRSEISYPNGLVEPVEGTGFLVHPDGWILTSAHVVPEVSKKGVTLSSTASIGGRGELKRTFVVKRRDMDKDLALLLLEHEAPKPWPTVKIDMEWVLKPDQDIFALGFPAANPESLDGIQGTIRSRLGEFWLTNASINPGNSGGPVFSQEGRVVAVAMGARSGANQMNVVVPIRRAIGWLDEIGVETRYKDLNRRIKEMPTDGLGLKARQQKAEAELEAGNLEAVKSLLLRLRQEDIIQEANVTTIAYVNADGTVHGVTAMKSNNPWNGACVIPVMYVFDGSGNLIEKLTNIDQRCVGANNPLDGPHERNDHWESRITNVRQAAKAAILHFEGGNNPVELLKENVEEVRKALSFAQSLTP